MPYIKQANRKALQPITNALGDTTIDSAGELNYLITKICIDFLLHQAPGYQAFNDAIGALEGAKLELYRRKIASYEDTKIIENGDVYV
jgi:hypothetical protein